MKRKVIQVLALCLIGSGVVSAQEIPQTQVPSVILNNFKKEFPKASDVDWEKQGDLYNVDFEIAWLVDYEAWFTELGELVKYTVEISGSDLPKAVRNAISKQYVGYRIDDAKKIIENGSETFKVELEKGTVETEVIFSKNGQVILL